MRFSTILLLCALGLIGYGFVHEGVIPIPNILSSASSPEAGGASSLAEDDSAPHYATSAFQATAVKQYGAERGDQLYNEWLKTTPQWEVHGTAHRRLPEGHLYATGVVIDPKNRSSIREPIMLWGLPEAAQLIEGDIFDCYAARAEFMVAADGTRGREYIYEDPAGRPIRELDRSMYK